jgi:predicted CoA-binding protein
MKTLVIGASPNPARYSFKAISLLRNLGYEVIPLGIRSGKIKDLEILRGKPKVDMVHTVTLYIGIDKQFEYYDYILSLHPKRIIFNPGTENGELEKIAYSKGIRTLNNCTLVMLNSGIY